MEIEPNSCASHSHRNSGYADERRWPQRLVSALIAFGSGGISLATGLMLSIGAVFATLIDPALAGREWWRVYSGGLLFNGWVNFVSMAGLLFVTTFCASNCLLQIASAWLGKPSIAKSLSVSLITGIIVTSAVLASLWCLTLPFS